jgi:hypothetical protein
VRSGLLGYDELLAELTPAVAAELGESSEAARLRAEAWVREETAALLRDETGWPATTDYDRLQHAFADLEDAGVVVLQGCADHWSAKAELDRRARQGRPPLGIAWFTPLDVWHAIDDGMLEVNVWHGSTANVAPGDDLLRIAVAAFERRGLEAHYDEGRVEVAASWRRRRSTARGRPDGSA